MATVTDLVLHYSNDVLGEGETERQFFYEDNGISAAFVGKYTYIRGVHIHNGFEANACNGVMPYNLQIGRSNSLGVDLTLIYNRNHNTRNVSLGGLEAAFLASKIIDDRNPATDYNHKASIIIQNDTWIGENSTIMSGVTVHNGAVIARNSHVVSDVPPYAIVGGNPARVIGYRFDEDIIEKLQTIQWWYWDVDTLIERYPLFPEDVEGFCNAFYDEAKEKFDRLIERRQIKDDAYFMLVDCNEKYACYPKVIEQFLDKYIGNENKRLICFIQSVDSDEARQQVASLVALVNTINNEPNIKCRLEIVTGDRDKAQDRFLECSHYITLRTFDTVYFTCLADRLGVEVISGVDTIVQFEKHRNMAVKV